MTEAPLPGFLGEIERVAGRAAALRAAQAFGGRTVWLPQRPVTGQRWTDILGLAAAETIARELGHGHQVIPLGPFSTPARRAVEIARGDHEGKSAGTIARSVGVHERTVHRHRRRRRAIMQPDLFSRRENGE